MSDVESQLQQIADRLEDVDTKVSAVKRHVVGGLDEKGKMHRGLSTRVEDIETREQARAKWIGAALISGIGALVTLIGRLLWHFITTNGNNSP